jgi:hypothetical protein
MKVLNTITLTIVLNATILLSQYDSTTLAGSWIWKSILLPYDSCGATYMTFNGTHIINEFSWLGFGNPAGTYRVLSSGDFILSMPDSNRTLTLPGLLYSDSSAAIMSNDNYANMFKINNVSLCKGVWTGFFKLAAETLSVILTVKDSGIVESCDPFAPPYNGKLFGHNGIIAGYFKTGEGNSANYKWATIQLGGTISGNIISGYLSTMKGIPRGTFNLARSATSINLNKSYSNEISGKYINKSYYSLSGKLLPSFMLKDIKYRNRTIRSFEKNIRLTCP